MSETVEQRRAIDSRGKTIVSASAGSGKTFVMVSRIVELLTSREGEIKNMLAVTFTNKAAAQMRDRIRRALLEAVSNAEGEVRDALKEQLRTLPLADISTIHAFCGRLIRTYFYLVDVDPAFRIVSPDDAEGKALCARALNETFEEAYEGGGDFADLLAVYFRKKKDERLKNIVTELYIAVRGDADYVETLSVIAAGGENLFGKAADALAGEYRRRAQSVLARAKRIEEEALLAPPKVQEYYQAIVDAATCIAGGEDLFAMCGCVLSLPKAPSRTAKTEPALVALINKLRAISDGVKKVYGELKGYHVREVELARCENANRQAQALAALALTYDNNYNAVKREAGVLDYGDLEHLALKILAHPEAKAALAEKYTHVFVDEYQDVNPMQERILSLLAGGDVFLVGDKKQAIYGFRGSKSKYFSDKITSYRADGNSLSLSANFRSAAEILRAANTVFSAALADYEPMRGGERYGDFQGEVLCHQLPAKEEETRERGVYSVMRAAKRSVDNAIARKVAAIVEEEAGRKEGLGKTWYDVNDGVQKDVRYGDIAVLVRKNTKAAGAIVNALSERGIPVTASAEVNICEHFEVRLLIDWLSFLDNAEQDIPMASSMLSVLGGFTERELALIRIKSEMRKEQGAWIESFRAACAIYMKHYREGNDPLYAKLARFFALCERYRSLARVHTAAEMLVLLLAEGLEAQIAAKGESEVRLAHVRRLVAESESCGNIHEFLHRLKDCDYRVDFSETGGENAVHVLTMHASKGLEFPVVILTELDEEFRGPDHDDIMWTDEFHIAPRCFDLKNKTYGDTLIRKAAALTKRREEVEGERNLLYVGMTRACCRLHMIFEGEWERPETAEEELFSYCPDDAKKLSDFIPRMQLLQYMTQTAEDPVFEKPDRAPLYRPDEAETERIRRAGAPYAHAESTRVPVKDSATGLMKRNRAPVYRAETEENEPPVSEIELDISDMDATFTTETGLAYHAFLEHVNFAGEAGEELVRMRREALLTDEQLALLDPVRLTAILAMPSLRRLAEKKLYREQRFLVKFPASDFTEAYGGTKAGDEVIFQGAIDLLVEEGDGRYTIYDYKFSGHDDARIHADYALQMKLYRKTVAKIAGVREEDVAVRILNLVRGSVIEM